MAKRSEVLSRQESIDKWWAAIAMFEKDLILIADEGPDEEDIPLMETVFHLVKLELKQRRETS